MNGIEIRRLENSVFRASFWVIMSREEPYFIGNEIASSLGFKKPRNMIDRHVDEEDKMTLEELFKGGPVARPPLFFQNMQPHQIIINELAFYGLCLKSNLPSIRPFQRWVYESIREIRKGNILSFQNLSLENNPVEKIKSTLSQIPPFESIDERIEREEMHKVYNEGFEESKDNDAVKRGAIGGSITQKI